HLREVATDEAIRAQTRRDRPCRLAVAAGRARRTRSPRAAHRRRRQRAGHGGAAGAGLRAGGRRLRRRRRNVRPFGEVRRLVRRLWCRQLGAHAGWLPPHPAIPDRRHLLVKERASRRTAMTPRKVDRLPAKEATDTKEQILDLAETLIQTRSY